MTPRIGPDDIRGQRIGFRLDPAVKAAVRQAARDAGMSAAAWMRDAALSGTAYLDTARRPAPYRARQASRGRAEAATPPTVSVSAREKAAIEEAAARAEVSVSDWIREAISRELERGK